MGVALPLLGFVLIATQVMEHPTFADRAMMLAFRTPGDPNSLIGPPWLQNAARDVTSLGSFTVLGALSAGVVGFCLITGDHRAALVVLVAVVGAIALNTIMKAGFERPRPDIVLPVAQVFTASFPSGHAAVSSSTYMTLAVIAGAGQRRRTRFYFLALAVILIFFIGLSRIYLGVHYPSDVIAGWCIGVSWAVACWAVIGGHARRASADA